MHYINATSTDADSVHYNKEKAYRHLRDRIHLFQDNFHHLTYGKVHVRKTSDYRMTLNRLFTVSVDNAS